VSEFSLVPLRLNYRQITVGLPAKTRLPDAKTRPAYRERLDDHLSTNSLRFADQPDDRILGPSHSRTGALGAGDFVLFSLSGTATTLRSMPSLCS